MRTSEQTNEIAAALAKAQGEMKNPEKTKRAEIPTKAGGKYSFNYADLPGTYDANRAVLAKNGLSHTFATTMEEGGVKCTCRLGHSSGQWYEAELGLPESGEIKSLAANLTYLRRYLYSGLVGVAGEEDVDGDPESADSKYTSRARSKPKTEDRSPPPQQQQQQKKPAAAVGADPNAPGEWVVPLEKFKGKKVKDIPIADARAYVEMIRKSTKVMPEGVAYFHNVVEAYAKLVLGSPKSDAAPFDDRDEAFNNNKDTTDDLPF